MLVITRCPGEKILIGENVELTAIAIKGKQVKLAIDAPDSITILRAELAPSNNGKLKQAMDSHL